MTGVPHPSATERVTARFASVYGQQPTHLWSAPGRVNLIGEHTDYNDGFVLPFALPLRTAVALTRADSRQWTVWSESGESVATFGEAQLHPEALDGWAAYPAAVVWALREEGITVPGARIAISSDIPLGAGLSSSAALECALLAALVELAGAELPQQRWPALAQRAENAFVGMPCGIMDQSAATLCRAGHALFLDCRSLGTEHVPFAPERAGLRLLVIDTRAPHRLVTGEYAERRRTCEAAAHRLGVPALRDVTDLAAALDALPDELSRRRVRHVVTENARVLDAVAHLRAGEFKPIGPLLSASHQSLRDDYEVTVGELDVAVEAALAAGAVGARMTGGGFGGCVIALVGVDEAAGVERAVRDAFAARDFAPPWVSTAEPSAGVSRHIER